LGRARRRRRVGRLTVVFQLGRARRRRRVGVLALHSLALVQRVELPSCEIEIIYAANAVRMLRSKNAAPNGYHVLNYCHGLDHFVPGCGLV
jgi:hypothetical protein